MIRMVVANAVVVVAAHNDTTHSHTHLLFQSILSMPLIFPNYHPSYAAYYTKPGDSATVQD